MSTCHFWYGICICPCLNSLRFPLSAPFPASSLEMARGSTTSWTRGAAPGSDMHASQTAEAMSSCEMSRHETPLLVRPQVTYMYVYMRKYIHISLFTYIYIYIHIYKHTHVYIYIYIYCHILCLLIDICIYTCIYTYTYMYIHMYIHE